MVDTPPKISPASKAATPEERRAAAAAMGSARTEKKRAALAKSSPINGLLGGRPTKPLSEIPCSCGAGDVIEGHKWDCPRAQAIKRRNKRGIKVEF